VLLALWLCCFGSGHNKAVKGKRLLLVVTGNRNWVANLTKKVMKIMSLSNAAMFLFLEKKV